MTDCDINMVVSAKLTKHVESNIINSLNLGLGRGFFMAKENHHERNQENGVAPR